MLTAVTKSSPTTASSAGANSKRATRPVEVDDSKRGQDCPPKTLTSTSDGIEEPKRSTLEALRRTILEIVPDAEQVISYKVPAFRVDGRIVAGFAAFKDHLSYLPFSGSVLPELAGELEGYTMTKSALHFPVDRPLPKTLVRKLIAARRSKAARS